MDWTKARLVRLNFAESLSPLGAFISMQAFLPAFHTPSTPDQFAVVMHILEAMLGRSALYSRDCSRAVFDYTLFDEKEHTLHTVCTTGNLPVLKYLVEEVKVNIRADHDHAVIVASKHGHLEMVQYLEGRGANIHALNNCAFQLASKEGHLEVVKYLAGKGADIRGVLASACYGGHLEVITYLLEQGASARHMMEWTCRYGRVEIVKYLVEEVKVNIHAERDEALRVASQHGQLEVVKYLISKGANAQVHMDHVDPVVRRYLHNLPEEVLCPFTNHLTDQGNLTEQRRQRRRPRRRR
jgi:Ankyrin repeats (3 copies)